LEREKRAVQLSSYNLNPETDEGPGGAWVKEKRKASCTGEEGTIGWLFVLCNRHSMKRKIRCMPASTGEKERNTGERGGGPTNWIH